jgi:23S rRNA pseudouridine1911/1915/1917 synthase
MALIHCIPHTGRTHQIRVHLAHSGHPVVGDKIYGPSEECYLEFIETGFSDRLHERLWWPRHALHSCFLGVSLSGTAHSWQSPLPHDLEDLLRGE